MISTFDVRLKTPFSCILAGPSRAGKTTFVFNLLSQADYLFQKKPDYVIYYYNQWQPLFDQMKSKHLVDEFKNFVPTKKELESLSSKKKGKNNICIIIDDFMQVQSEDISEVFTALSHHLNLNCIYITQNLFSKNNRYMRDMSLSATYLVLFKNPRDSSQIVHLAKQFAPGRVQSVVNAFRELTKKPYSYVLFDLHQASEEEIRMRTHIFSHEKPLICVAIPT